MPFSRRSWYQSGCALIALVGLITAVLLGCEARVVDEDDVLDDVAQRVEDNTLPRLLDESSVVLRNLMNLLAAFPEICATRLAALGSFTSSLAALGRPDTVTLDDDEEEGAWHMRWRNVVLGDSDGPPTADADALPVDITLTVFFRNQDFTTLQAVPFALAAPSDLRTTGEPPAFAAGAEGFFLFQDAATGEWTLRWRALGTPKVFEGRIAGARVSRLINRLENGSEVSSLAINNAQVVTFSETTGVGEEKGFTFFAEPGEAVLFQLRIGPEGAEPQEISRDQLRIGGDDQPLPADQEPAEFLLASNVPIGSTTMPMYVPGVDVGTFIWQDIDTNDCGPAEDQWRIRVSTDATRRTFSGTIEGLEDDDDAVGLRAFPVGSCPAGNAAGAALEYSCPLRDAVDSGYDICVTTGARVLFDPEVDGRPDPGLVFIGAEQQPDRLSPGAFPPSPDPFTILFDITITESQSPRELEFDESLVVMRGNNEDAGTFQLNPDQVSLEPLCSVPGEQTQPRVRLTGEGEYATERFEGSIYVLGNVQFTDANVDSLRDGRRFPDRGVVRLETREAAEDADIVVQPEDITTQGNVTTSFVDVGVFVNNVLFTFRDQPITLTVE